MLCENAIEDRPLPKNDFTLVAWHHVFSILTEEPIACQMNFIHYKIVFPIPERLQSVFIHVIIRRSMWASRRETTRICIIPHYII